MGIFSKRPFAVALFSLIISTVAVYALAVSGILLKNAELWVDVFKIVILLIAFSVVVFIVWAIRNPRLRVRLVTIILVLCFFAIGFFRSSSFFLRSYLPLQELVGENLTINATVWEREVSSAAYARYRVTVSSVLREGEILSPNAFSAVLVLDTAGAYAVGDRISAEVKGCTLSDVYPYPSYALADGCTIALLCEDGAESVKLDGRQTEESTFLSVVKASRSLQEHLSFVLSEGISGDVGAFASAVLLGDRSGLSEDVSRDFGRSGIAHILALSGLHMSVLIGGLVWILRKIGLHRRVVSAVTIVAIFGFLLLTGFSMSACRAGLMLAFVAILGFFSRQPDPLTSLFLAVSMILLILPPAVASVGLWMSFSSVFGLLVFMPRINDYFRTPKAERGGFLGCVKRMLRGILTAVLVTVIASLSVLPILYLSGGEFPLFSVLTNLLTVFLVPYFLVFCLLFLLFRRVVMIGAVLRTLLRLIGGFIITTARQISYLPNATVSLSYSFVGAALLIFLLPTFFLLCMPPRFFVCCKAGLLRKQSRGEDATKEGKKQKLHLAWFLLPPAIMCVVYGVCLFAHFSAFSTMKNLPVSVISVSDGEIFLVREGSSSVLVDLSEGYYSGYREAEIESSENGCTEWSRIVLTECRMRHLSTVPRFCRSNLVREILLPTPASDQESLYTEGLVERLNYYEIPYTFYEREHEVPITESHTIMLSEPVYLDRSVRPTFFLTLSGEERLLYLSQSIEESALYGVAREQACEAEILVYGSRGPNRRVAYPTMATNDKTRLVLLYGEANQWGVIIDRTAFREELFRYDEKVIRIWKNERKE